METTELLEIIARNEDSKHQLKANVTNEISLAQELIAFSNTLGGMLIIGASDNGTISGLTRADMGRLSNLVSNAASQQIKPPINPITEYIDSQDITGTLKNIFDDTLGFILRNVKRTQQGQGVNSLGELAVPKIVFEELIANALIHRDYFISATIRIFIFNDRIEIISPGHLPNNLTIENIKSGNSNIRNPILASFAAKILPYRGLGSGIRRALKAYKNIEFTDDRDGNTFNATVKLDA